MPGQATVNNLDAYLDVFGQQASLNIYTQICLCFPVHDASSHPAIINTLTKGLERLSESFPWVAGQVVNEGSVKGNTGVFKIIPLDKTPRLVVKDLTSDTSIPTMDEIRQAQFPFSMLDENIIAPRNTLPSPEELASETPVFVVQANFITGGLLLTFVGQHQVMDMTGQGQIMHLLSKACHNEPFTSEELSSGNADRRNIIPLLDDSYNPGPELAHQIIKPSPSNPVSNGSEPPATVNSTWTYFNFSSTSLNALKSRAAQSISPTSGFISTDDALSALIWQAVTRARLPRLDPTTESTLARAVDMRHYLDIPQTYTGLVQNMTYNTYTLQQLVEEPLGRVASQLRSTLDRKILAYNTRALATLLDRTPDKNIISITATLDLSSDIMLSSWAKVNCYALDFNLGLGKPKAVRRPLFVPVESLIYLMPKSPDGEIAVAICLRDQDMKRLIADQDFAKYGTYIP